MTAVDRGQQRHRHADGRELQSGSLVRYGRDFKVAHVQNGTVVQTDTHAVTEHFDLTAQVPGGRLYGGAFTAEACGADSVQSFAAGQNAMDFTPEAGATYYIWEPSDVYLAPRNYNVCSMSTAARTASAASSQRIC